MKLGTHMPDGERFVGQRSRSQLLKRDIYLNNNIEK